MGQQLKKIVKRRRRADYLKRKSEQAKLGGLLPKATVKKVAKAETEPNLDKPVAAKKATAKKAAKKAPAKKAAKKAVKSESPETVETPEAVEETKVDAAEASPDGAESTEG